MKMKILFYIIFFLVMINICYGAECTQEEFNRCAEPLDRLQLTTEFQIGKNENLDELCQDLRKGMKCIQSYTRRCFNMDQRNHFNKMYHGTNQFIRDLCNAGSFRDEYLKHTSCISVRYEYRNCAAQHKNVLIFMKPLHNQDNQEIQGNQGNQTILNNITTICCSLQDLIECSEEVAKTKCGEDTSRFVRDLLQKFITNLVKVNCDDYANKPYLCGRQSSTSSGFQQSQPFIITLLLFMIRISIYEYF